MGTADAGRQVQHQEVNDAVGGTNVHVQQVNNHLEQTVHDGVNAPQKRCRKQETELQRFGDAHQAGSQHGGNYLCFGCRFFVFLGSGNKGQCNTDDTEGFHQTIGQEAGGIRHHGNGRIVEQCQKYGFCANNLLTVDNHAVTNGRVEERRPDKVMQTGGNQHTVQETVQEHAKGPGRRHDSRQRIDTCGSYGPDIGRYQSQCQHHRQQYQEHKFAVAVQCKGALEFGINKTIMYHSHNHAQDHSQENAHVGYMIAQANRLARSIQGAGVTAFYHQARNGKPFGVCRQPDQITDQCHKGSVRLTLFGKAHGNTHAEKDAQVSNNGTHTAVDKLPHGPKDTAFGHNGCIGHDRRKGLNHTGKRQKKDRTHQSFGKVLHGVHDFCFH